MLRSTNCAVGRGCWGVTLSTHRPEKGRPLGPALVILDGGLARPLPAEGLSAYLGDDDAGLSRPEEHPHSSRRLGSGVRLHRSPLGPRTPVTEALHVPTPSREVVLCRPAWPPIHAWTCEPTGRLGPRTRSLDVTAALLGVGAALGTGGAAKKWRGDVEFTRAAGGAPHPCPASPRPILQACFALFRSGQRTEIPLESPASDAPH